MMGKLNRNKLYPSFFVAIFILGVFLLPQIRYWHTKPGVCKLVNTPQITVTADGQSQKIKFPLIRPMEVAAEKTVMIIIDLETGPPGCNNTFSVNWQLAFVSNLSAVRISHESPTLHILEFTTGDQIHHELEEDLISLAVQDVSGTHFWGTLRFKVVSKGE